MSFSFSRATCVAAFSLLPTVGLATDIIISDPYARVSRPGAPTGAAFMIITNNGQTEDRLLSASSDAAQQVELHTHKDLGDGVMKMTEIEEGIPLPAGGSHEMKRGGDHVMFMGLNTPLEQGGEVAVTFTFEQAGDLEVIIPVDNERQPNHGQSGGHNH